MPFSTNSIAMLPERNGVAWTQCPVLRHIPEKVFRWPPASTSPPVALSHCHMHVSLRRFILGVAALLIAAAAVQRFSLLAATPSPVTPRPTPGSSRPPSGHGRRRWQPIASPPPPKAGAPQAEGTAAECAKMRLEHLVVVGVAWGTLSAAKQMRWTRLGCDMLLQSPFEADVAATGAVSEVFLQRYRSNHRTALAGREAGESCTFGTLPPSPALIAAHPPHPLHQPGGYPVLQTGARLWWRWRRARPTAVCG